MSKLLTLPGIIPAKLNHFLPLPYRVPGLKNPCPSHHLSPGPSRGQQRERHIIPLGTLNIMLIYTNSYGIIRTRIIGQCAMYHSPKFPPLEKWLNKNTLKIYPLEIKGKGKKKTPEHTKRGNFNALAHGLIVRVLTVSKNRLAVPRTTLDIGRGISN